MQSRGTMSLASAAGSSSSTAEIPTHRPSGEPITTSEQLMQVDQAITLTLQEIDANFARCHQTITGKILPSIRRYGVASHNTWQGARFWHRFFETASDINLVPTYGGDEGVETSQEPSSTSFTSQDQQDASTSFSGLSRKGAANEAEEDEDSSGIAGGDVVVIDDSGELDERDFEMPRVSEASKAATERHRPSDDDSQGRAAWATVESPFERLKRDVDSDFAAGQERTQLGNKPDEMHLAQGLGKPPSMRNIVGSTPNRAGGSKLAAQVLQKQHEQQNKSAIKVQATPRRGGPSAGNPFAANGKEGQSSRKEDFPNRWNGIADLRKTPLAKVKGESRKGKQPTLQDNGNDSVDSMGWPAGMSPPVTTQFSVPQKKYIKTPAKAAARLAVDDLLRTIEGASPATRRNLIHRMGGESRSLAGTGGTHSNLTSTPLKRAPVKGRKSLPTPPTVTKRMGGTTRFTQGSQGTQSPAATSSARLLDEDEDGNEEEGQDLGPKFSKLALTQTSASIDELLQARADDDDDSEEEESDSEEEDEEGMQVPSRNAVVSSSKNGAADYPTNSSLASNSRSIDQDTLFGIRDPHKPAATVPSSALRQSTNFSSSSSEAPTQSSSTNGSGSRQNTSYQPINPRLYEQGTVYSGRPLLNDDREDTFSAPSPTPATTSTARRSK